jgi:hypothetical protein
MRSRPEGNVICMLVILGLVWGGFGYCLFLPWTRKNPKGKPDELLE